MHIGHRSPGVVSFTKLRVLADAWSVAVIFILRTGIVGEAIA
jgi:hypothetical protein